MSTSQGNPNISNARDLVERILVHPQGGIAALLQLAEDQETDWLEFKAALHPEGGVFQPGENADDYCWHVARAAVALANTAGGAVILGLDDNLQPVGLAASDPKGILESKGREPFNREILNPAVTGGQWTTGRCGTLRLQGSLTSLVDIHNADYQGYPLAVILVAPMPDDELLEVSELRNNRERLIIPVRVPGAVGQVRDVHGRKETRDYERARETQLRSHRYAQIWERFITSLPGEVPATPADLIDARVEQRLAEYSAECVKSWRSLNELFTLLDLEERDSGDIAAHDREFVPEAEEWRDLFDSDDPWDTDDLDGDRDDDDDQDQVEDEAQEQMPAPLRKGSVFDLLAQEDRAILLGEPGAGKSTCLQRLALRQAEAYQAGATLALYVPLRSYTDQGLKSLIERLGRQPWPVIEALIQTGRLHLLLDAVNECPRHLQERCCQDIKALLDTYPDLPVLVTARNLSYRCQLRLPTFIVRPLDAKQQQGFLTAYLRGDAARASALLEQIQKQPGGALIASNPLLLRIVVEVSRGQGELPQGRALLYRHFFEDWYRREEKKESRTGAALRWSFPRTLEALSSLALAARQAGEIEIARVWAEQTLRPLLADDVVPFLERIAQGLLLELDADQESLRFSHETVQEYLAAEALIRQPEALAGVPEEAAASWRMPLAYAFELAPDLPESLVREAWQREPLLVAVALRDDTLLSSLPIAEDANPWLTGVLRTLRGESCDAESQRIAQALLYPPVHPLPDAVANALASQAVWYAGLTHDAGKERLERLRRLITEHEEPWLDIIFFGIKSTPEWFESLDSYRLLFTENPQYHLTSLTIQQISFAKRYSLLGLHIRGHMNKYHKMRVIRDASAHQLLAIASQSWRKFIPLNKASQTLDILLRVNQNWNSGLFSRKEIESEKIQQTKIWKPRLIHGLKKEDIQQFSRKYPSQYKEQELNNKIQIFKDNLKNVFWETLIVNLDRLGRYGFVAHPAFQQNIFFYSDCIEFNDFDPFDIGEPLNIGDTLVVEIHPQLRKSKKRNSRNTGQSWNFAVKEGYRTKGLKMQALVPAANSLEVKPLKLKL